MKRLFLVLFSVVAFAFSAHAVAFRSTQSICSGTTQMILYSNGNVKIYDDGVLMFSGTYSIVRDSGAPVVELYVEGETLRCTFRQSREQKINSLTFRGAVYTPCSR